mgnify:CR=1 FL=1
MRVRLLRGDGHSACGPSAYRAICARVTDRLKSLPLPADPNLAAWASALNEAGHWAEIYDASRRLVFATDELRLSFGDTGAVTVLPIGFHFFSAEAARFRGSVNRRFLLPEHRRAHFLETGPYVFASTPGGREERRRVVDHEFADLVDRGLVDAITRILEGLAGVAGDSLAPEVRRQMEKALRDLLIVLRDVIDAVIERIDNRREPDVEIEEIPID